MKNRFLENPTEDDIMEIGEEFLLRDAVVAIDSSDIREIMEEAENAIILTGKATGRNRCADAIEDAVLHTCSMADGYYLFSAEKGLLYVVSPKDIPLLMSESEAINTFFEMFHHDTICKWGLAEEDISEVKVVIIASNLRKKSQI